MYYTWPIAACLSGTVFLSGCASLNRLHDPQTGLIGRDQIPPFLKSVRCELTTFYQANAYRRTIFETKIAEANRIKIRAKKAQSEDLMQKAQQVREEAVRDGANFPVSPELFGGVFLNLKIMDTLGIGAGDTNLVNKQVQDATHSETWGVSPVLNTQNTYEMNFSFLIDQASGISLSPRGDPFKCYDSPFSPNVTPLMLADGSAGETAQFTRILVNNYRPLAAWLLDNSDQAWVNFRARNEEDESEQIIPVQMNYAFTVQVNAGVNVKYSLTAPVWSPAQVGVGAGSVQTSQMSIYLNGDDASLAGGAKLGSAVNTLGSDTKTPYVPKPRIGRREIEHQLAETSRDIKALENEKNAPSFRPNATPPSAPETNASKNIEDRITRLKANQEALRARLRETPAQLRPWPNVRALPAGNRRGYLNSPIGITPP